MEEKKTCKGCGQRHIGCHSTCEDYKEYRREKDEEIAKRKREYATTDYIVRQTIKGKRKKR